MAQKIDVPMPQDLDLTSGWTVQVTAVDATGAVVTGVKVSNFSIIADAPTPATADGVGALGFVVGPYMLVPGPGA